MGLVIVRYLILCAISIAMLLAFFYVRNLRMRRKRVRLQQRQEILDTYYETLKEQSDMMEQYRREIAETLQGVQDMTNYQPAGNEMQVSESPCYSKQKIVESVLQHKISECVEACIKVTYQVVDHQAQAIPLLNKDLDLSDMDIVGVFYNLFDNMIEANKLIPEVKQRWIHIRCEQQEKQTILRFENAKPAGAVLNAGRKTSKRNKAEHGIGLSIMTNLVEKYNGSIHWTEGDDMFSVEMTLPTKMKTGR